MKSFFLFAALLLAAVNVQAQDIKAEIFALGNAWKAAFERGDATAIAAVYADQVDIVNDDDSVVTVSRTDVAANWAKTFAVQTGTVEFADDMVVTLLSDNKASTKGSFTQTMTDKKTSESMTFKGYYEHQAVKVDGRWLLSRMKVKPQ